LPIITQQPVLVNSTANGQLFMINEITPPLRVLHVYGTPYQMGYANGFLLKDQINDLFDEFYVWLDDIVNQNLHTLPKFIQDFIDKYGIAAALDLTYALTEKYIPEVMKQEFQGFAEGAGRTYTEVVRVQMLPELIQAQCSIIGAWGKAVRGSDGMLYQVRALDWNTNGPFQKSPLVLVYHPLANNGHAFSILSWSGFLGGLTGFSSAPVGICEKVWLRYDGFKSREGIPFTVLLRDILQYDYTVTDAINRIIAAHRTCSIFIGLGDGRSHFNVVEYSYETVAIFDDMNFQLTNPVHIQFDDIVYVDKHEQPSHDPCLPSLLQQQYGAIDPQNVIQNITAVFQTGDMHIGIYDFKHNLMYVSNASPYVNNTAIPAYDRQFISLNMTQLFAQKI